MVANSGSDLKFDIAAPPGWSYDAGDTIIGNLMRYTPISTTQATVELALVGRTEAKVNYVFITKKEIDDGPFESSHYTLLRGKPQLVFCGPVQHSENSKDPLSFPFSVQIPHEPERSAREGRLQATSFLPLEGDHPSHHVMPGTFKSPKTGGLTAGSLPSSLECKVEYFLEATLEYQSEGRQICRARYPIAIRHPARDDSNRLACKTITAQCSVRSHLLLPGAQTKRLSFKQKSARIFGASSIPCCHFQLNMTVPLAIKIGDSQPFQVTLGMTPLREHTSPIIQDVAQKVRINWVKLSLKCITNVPVNGEDQGGLGEQNVSHMLNLEGAFWDLEYPLVTASLSILEICFNSVFIQVV
ncbi:hypothetical protein N7456_005814 [Penicillium angulare]|uniref:Arrestin-like N-terminal domain-containing protein n=1 Tax=Penicillium angulare TaxID=116970 RepID=A0A9W9KJN9_9EURO|nr:hypothetical protein N7456_005814 [Penicillium angulare]